MTDRGVTFLRDFVAHCPTAIALFDQDMRYLAASERWMGGLHLSQALIGQSHDAVFPEISEAWKSVNRQALAGETVKASEDGFQRSDGHVEWLNWQVRP